MDRLTEKIGVSCDMLLNYSLTSEKAVRSVYYTETGYKSGNTPPSDGWKPYNEEIRLSGNDRHYWFKLNFKTPKTDDNRCPVLIGKTGYEGQRNDINPQSMVYINGRLVQAFDSNHTRLRLQSDTEYEVYIYFYIGSGHHSCKFRLSLGEVDMPSEKLYYDILVPLSACKSVYLENSYEYSVTMNALDFACNMLELNYPYTEEYYTAIENACEYMQREYYEKVCGNSTATVDCIGHTHIDVAWLWTLAQTKEKIQRSMATVTELMKYYPEYKFMMSQPQLLKYLSQECGSLYDEIKELAREGRFEVEGAMWLEADCNLTSGESLVRQIIYGKRFMKEEFGVDSKILWLPDVFGYSASLPQILKKSGITHFVTSKISWNDTNMLPYDTFIWQGIDGSEIMTDFITTQNYQKNGEYKKETTYVGLINPSMVAGCWNRYQQKSYNNDVMLVYGWGDGGGGPTADMLEQQRRLSYSLPSIPKTNMCTLTEHLEKVERNFALSCENKRRTPKWVGELYLEFHRGTYTSMAQNKRYNRMCELLMQKAEAISVINRVNCSVEYPGEAYRSIWETILLNQFHDIIPGSAIRQVYEDSHKQYEDILQRGRDILSKNLSCLADNLNADDGILVYNSLGFDRSDIIKINGKSYETDFIPSYGWRVIKPYQKPSNVTVKNNSIENKFFILELDEAGRIKMLFDKRFERNILSENSFANEIQIFEDMPVEYENWEISEYYNDKCKILSSPANISVVDDGCRKGFKILREYKNSQIVQYLYLYDNIERIDFENEFEWNETKQLVKIAFPFDIHTDKATFDIQFGNIERNTHRNTSWDKAKFEVCAHKWVDLSEGDYGVSLLNDCKYGFSVEGSVLKLTALKCGTYPNDKADRGHHSFRYSIYPHKGDFRCGGTQKAAYSFNQPLEYCELGVHNPGPLPSEYSFVGFENENIVIDTLKACESGDGFILRLYDAYNVKSKVKLDFGCNISSAYICDLTENIIEELRVDKNTLTIPVKNFEIVTLKIFT